MEWEGSQSAVIMSVLKERVKTPCRLCFRGWEEAKCSGFRTEQEEKNWMQWVPVILPRSSAVQEDREMEGNGGQERLLF